MMKALTMKDCKQRFYKITKCEQHPDDRCYLVQITNESGTIEEYLSPTEVWEKYPWFFQD